jgi:predicted  nucleic acid-binding Zn-ribbon protein
MPQEIELAQRLQRMDRQLAQLEAEIRALPKKIAELEKQLEAHERRLEADQASLEANQTEQRRLSRETSDHREKIGKLKKQLMQATTQEQLTAFQHEIDFCEQQIAANEEKAFRLLEEGEAQAETVKEAARALAAEKELVEKRKQEAQALSEEDRKKGVRLYRERQQLGKEVPPKLLEHYEKIRKRHKDGVVVAECTDGSCSSCMMTVRPALLQMIRSNPETLYCCESCLRMLYYNPTRPA